MFWELVSSRHSNNRFIVLLQKITITALQERVPPDFILQNGVCIPTNPDPIADAGQFQLVPAGSTVVLDGSGSHATTPGAGITSYSWKQLPEGVTVTLNGANTPNLTFVAPNLPVIVHLTFSLVVTDSNGLICAPSSVEVDVVPNS
jgi:K319-like protein